MEEEDEISKINQDLRRRTGNFLKTQASSTVSSEKENLPEGEVASASPQAVSRALSLLCSQ